MYHFISSRIALKNCIFIAGLSLFSMSLLSDTLSVKVTRNFPTKTHPSIPFDGPIQASALFDITSKTPQIIVPVATGTISFLDAETGADLGQVELPRTPGLRVLIMSTPVQVESNLIVLYQMLGEKGRESHRVAVIDIAQRKLNADFPILELTAEIPQADGKAMVKFDSIYAFSHSEVKHAKQPGSELGFIYAAFGNAADIQPFHGWLFEIDLDAWKKQGTANAIKNTLVTTPESKCEVKYKYGTREMVCAGGIWTPAGPQIYYQGDDYELLVPTGNGQTNLARHDYANTLMRVKPGLDFDPGCDDKLCQNFNPTDPAMECIESCKNLFIPRLKPGDKPLKPVTGDCDELSYWECLAWMDYDLGANAPVKIKLSSQQSVIVQSGKEGAAYLLDANHLGTMFDRFQLIETCGTEADPCALSWRGMMVNHPAVSMFGEVPVVIFPTFVSDKTHAAGLIALKIVQKDGKPQFERFWQFSNPKNKAATATFRSAPTLPVITTLEKHGDVIWVIEIGSPGTLYGVRIKDGQLIAQKTLLGTGIPLSRPVALGNMIYITSKKSKGKATWVESYKID
ncbi:MAG: hypothetical protein V3V18_11000 [Methylococcales bacterium]